MPTPEELIKADLFARFRSMPFEKSISRLYEVSNPVGAAMASFHGRLNGLFDFMNEKAGVNHHFNADQSRELLDLISEIKSIQAGLKRVGISLELRDDYPVALGYVSSFLQRSGGSPIPDGFTELGVVEYEPVFVSSETEIELGERRQRAERKVIGEGAFANVFSYESPQYDKKFAIKRAKSDLKVKELERFRREFEILKGLNFPYVLEVYRYKDDSDQYTMEFCDSTVERYIATRNADLPFNSRRRIALQFVYGLNYLHRKGILHRDISLRNILVKVHDQGAATVKLSDFGLAKDVNSQMTRTDSETRGSIIDPALHSFKEYAVINEIYPIGHILSFIFSGRKPIDAIKGPVRAIVDRCVTHDLGARYQDVRAIIHDLEALKSEVTAAAQGAPA